MESQYIIAAIIIIAILVIVLSWRYRQSIGAKLGLIGFEIGGTNEQQNQLGINAKDVLSKKGGVLLDDSTGKGINAESIHAEDDVLISTSGKTNADPKV